MGNSKAVESCSIATNRKRNSHYCGSTVVYSYSIYGYSTVCIGPYKVGVVVFGFGAPSAGLPLVRVSVPAEVLTDAIDVKRSILLVAWKRRTAVIAEKGSDQIDGREKGRRHVEHVHR
eukprot:m.100226 g.100226  ORF g.100226 m.100226 type:complete len:118 (+) comp37085_c0_seq11:4801-5154(+)